MRCHYTVREMLQEIGNNTVEKNLRKIGFEQGVASTSVYYHPGMKISTLVHGDDYVSVGSEEAMQWLKEKLEDVYEIKTAVIGRKKGLLKEARVLNRVVRWTSEGWEYEADQRHGEIIVRETGMGEAKPVTTPSAEEK